MAIAGVEPVSYLHTSNGNADEIYTREQIRDILIKFAESVSVSEDIDYNWEEEPELVGFSLMMGGLAIDDDEGINEAVDEFMKSGEYKNELFEVVRNRIKEY